MTRKKIAILAAVTVTLVILSAFAVLTADDTVAASGKDIRVYIQTTDDDPAGKYVDYCVISSEDHNKLEWKQSVIKYRETTVNSASTVKNIYERAADQLNMPIKYNNLGQIETVNGKKPANQNTVWNVHQWMPLGTPTWASVGPIPKYDSMIITGATYCLHMSSSSVVNGTPVYGEPDFRPVSDGYVYFKFLHKYDAVTGEYKSLVPTDFKKRSDSTITSKMRKGAEVTVDFSLLRPVDDPGNGDTGVYYYFTKGKDPDFNGSDVIEGSKTMCPATGSKNVTVIADTSAYPDARCLVISILGEHVQEGGTGRYYSVLEISEGLVEDTFTKDMRQSGFWMKGRGANMGEVIIDIMDTNNLEFEYFSGNSSGNDLRFWIDSMFGIKGDESVGTDAWAYWSQYCYVNDKWGYNDYTLGYYDPGVYSYAACVYILSVDPNFNVSGDLPRISEFDPTTDVREIYKKVTFMDGNTILGTQTVRFGDTVDYNSLPSAVPPAGRIFAGWGDIGSKITGDTVFQASFADVSSDNLVRFFADEGKKALMHAEYVPEHGSSDYGGTVSRKSTVSRDFEFAGWSSPLSGIMSSTDMTPVFTDKKRTYDVSFLNYDGSVIERKSVGYGDALTEFPPDQFRPQSVEYTYEFGGWSYNLSEYREADLSCVKSGVMVYAYYESNFRLYEVSVMEGDTPVKKLSARYGHSIGEEAVTTMCPGYIVKLYRDSLMTREFMTDSLIYGDTTVYACKVPGYYTVGYGADANTVTVVHDAGTVSRLTESEGKVVIADIGQMKTGKVLRIDRTSLGLIADRFGRNARLVMAVPDGEITLNAGYTVDLGGNITFGISNAVCTGKMHSFLMTVNYYGIYTPELRNNDVTVKDVDAEIALPLKMASGAQADSARVWSLTRTGIPNIVDCQYDQGRVRFSVEKIINFVTGYDASSPPAVEISDVLPYGEVIYMTQGSTPETYMSTLVTMSLISKKSVVYIPSAMEGYPLKRISEGAFSNLSGANSLVIPRTVTAMNLSSLDGAGITDVYFLGDKPAMEGETRATLHRISGATGWDPSVDELEIHEYLGDTFSFEFFILGGEATLHRYLDGEVVDVPTAVNVDGMEYPMTYLGDSSFMSSVGLDKVTIPQSVKVIHTRAFYKSSVKEIVFQDRSPLTTICDEAFRECAELISPKIPSNVRYIGFEAFRMCNTFKTAGIPDSCLVLGDGVFYSCENLAEVYVGKGIERIPDRCFMYCILLNNVVLPDNVKSIGQEAFEKCSELVEIDTASVRNIGNRSFYLCISLEKVILGKDVESLGERTFFGCRALRTVDAYCDMPQDIGGAFEDTDSITFRVDAAASGWTIRHESLGKDDEPSSDTSPTVYILVAMTVAFVAIGIAAVRMKRGH